ncbi:MAG: hypothetical protein FWC77_06360 [Defluviitaleaceae bacterium]|nr:hypothetical protein [Defluviitaleaceae bacterium]
MKTVLTKCFARKNILLTAIWLTVIITGMIALASTIGGIGGLIVFGRIHGLAARVGVVYTTICILKRIFQYVRPIMNPIVIRLAPAKPMGTDSSSSKTRRAIRVTSNVILHIVLHVVSVHLAIAYTVFHIVRHRRGLVKQG